MNRNKHGLERKKLEDFLGMKKTENNQTKKKSPKKNQPRNKAMDEITKVTYQNE